MKVLVVDVAAEYGGAATILNQFINEFKQDFTTEYIVVLSKIHYPEESNIKFVYLEWVKRSYFHRLYFDNIYINKLVKQYNPDLVFSLQNKALRIGKVEQYVYFQNALPIAEKRFSLWESRELWIYQNIIGNLVRHSLKRADLIYVQAFWMKDVLSNKWRISKDRIAVKKPKSGINAVHNDDYECKQEETSFFYPANRALYKNHKILFKAMKLLWDNEKINNPLILTVEEKELGYLYGDVFANKDYPIVFAGRLGSKEMIDQYRQSVLVFPSYIETVGLPLIEAKELGSVIVAADCAYAHEAIGDYEKAYYFNPSNEWELVSIIKEKVLYMHQSN